MKRNRFKMLFFAALTALTLPFLLSVSASPARGKAEPPRLDGRASMTARITEIGERITVEVLESPYTSGVHIVHTPPETVYLDASGKPTDRTALSVGDVVRIRYSGQVMLSYPPQIVAAEISKLEN